MSRVSDDVKFQEIMLTIRHYSTLRFAIMTVFVAISGALLSKYFDCESSAGVSGFPDLLRIAGVIVSLAFLIFEFILDRNLSDLWNSVEHWVGRGDSLITHRDPWKRILTPIATLGLYVAVTVFWWLVSPDFYPCEINVVPMARG